MQNNIETIVLGGGCFWCTEGIFQRVPGVVSVVSGYAGGTVENPTYEQVSTGRTGHAEVVKVEYENSSDVLQKILDIFFVLHDPTSLNKQGNDVGTEYRSAVFFTIPEQEKMITDTINNIKGDYEKPIVTEVKPLNVFYMAEDYHQNYYNNNSNKPYCTLVIGPKLEKLNKILAKGNA